MTPDELTILALAATAVVLVAIASLGVATWRALGRLANLPPVAPPGREADR